MFSANQHASWRQGEVVEAVVEVINPTDAENVVEETVPCWTRDIGEDRSRQTSRMP